MPTPLACDILGELRQELRPVTVCSQTRMHFIGRLQRNKAARVVQRVARVHTIDSRRLADTISRLAGELGVHVRCLVQVNIGEEASKAGVSPDACEVLVDHLRGLPNVSVDGLMALPPRDGFAASRRWFRRLRILRDTLEQPGHALPHLSMGMSGDFDGAVAEGATFVRVGTALVLGIDDRIFFALFDDSVVVGRAMCCDGVMNIPTVQTGLDRLVATVASVFVVEKSSFCVTRPPDLPYYRNHVG